MNNMAQLRTGTANDGRVLVWIGTGRRATSALRDLQSRLPEGWIATVYEASGVDAVITKPDAFVRFATEFSDQRGL